MSGIVFDKSRLGDLSDEALGMLVASGALGAGVTVESVKEEAEQTKRENEKSAILKRVEENVNDTKSKISEILTKAFGLTDGVEYVDADGSVFTLDTKGNYIDSKGEIVILKKTSFKPVERPRLTENGLRVNDGFALKVTATWNAEKREVEVFTSHLGTKTGSATGKRGTFPYKLKVVNEAASNNPELGIKPESHDNPIRKAFRLCRAKDPNCLPEISVSEVKASEHSEQVAPVFKSLFGLDH